MSDRHAPPTPIAAQPLTGNEIVAPGGSVQDANATLVRAAEQALADNDLERAIHLAGEAIDAHEGDAGLRGRMCAVQAVAHFWLGAYGAAWRRAFVALQHLPRGSVGWYAAKGHMAMALGQVGRSADVLSLADDLASAAPVAVDWDAQVIALARTTVVLIRAGSIDRATTLFGGVEREGRDPTAVVARAWVNVALAEFARHRGDPVANLAHTEAAVAGFASAGDLRNACLQRANVGNAYALLGAYDLAENRVREALTVAASMRLGGFVESARSSWALALAHTGRFVEAVAALEQVIATCAQSRYVRHEARARVTLSWVRSMQGDHMASADAATRALAADPSSPHIRALALVLVARSLLPDRDRRRALDASAEAMDLMVAMGGIDGVEGLIRLTHAEALDAAGRAHEARAALAEARTRLLHHAAGIRDERWRRSYLEHVPEHARIVELARAWSVAS